MSDFKDHFSGHAGDYARFRPRYPARLFAWLAGQVAASRRAWDCGTGNGQAAVALAGYFDHVVASDPSARQVARAQRHPGVAYLVAPAERVPFADRSVDLVTVAQALHWFDLERFWPEVRRVLRPGGAVAAWCYGLMRVDEAVDRVVARFYHDVVGPWWPAERRHVERGYRDLAFPFESVPSPDLAIEAEMDLATLTGYLGTWSATRRCAAATGRDPLDEVAPELVAAWGNPGSRRPVRWPLTVRFGRSAG